MKNKVIIILVVLFLFASYAFAGGDGEKADTGKESIKISYGHGFMPETPHHKAVLRFKELVEERSNGRIEVNIFPAGQLGSAKEMFEGLQMGTQEIALVPTARISGFNQKLQLFDLPFLFPDRVTAYKVMDGPVGSVLLKTLKENGVVGVAYYEDGFKHFTSNNPIQKLEDFNGSKFRTMESPIIMEQFRAMGSNPTPVAFSEAYNAMQQGVVDGQENPLVTITNMKFYEVQDYLLLSSHAYLAHVLMFSEPWFNKLSTEDQEMLTEIGREIASWQRNLVAEEEEQYLQTIRDSGTKILELAPAERERMKAVMGQVYIIAEDVIGKDILDQALKAVE
jgi:tripartite ATP-independent transporter DctP family solute receptor